MALSCRGVCRGASLILLYGKRPVGVKASLCTPSLAPTKPSSLWFVRHYSPSQARHGIGRSVVSGLKWANEKYERFLQRRFPRFYVIYHTFMKGFRLLFQDGKEVRRIVARMLSERIEHQNLPYRDMEKVRQLRKDLIKAIPLVIISIPPFANYLVFILMYLYPRQLLIRHFWTPQQLVEFQGVYHAQRAQHHWAIIKGMESTSTSVQDSRLRSRLSELCSKVRSGVHPVVSDVHAVRTLFSGPPLGIRSMYADQMRHLCALLFLTPRLPGFWIGRRLNSHAFELMQLDRAIVRLGLHQLNDTELREACYVRGLNPDRLSSGQCKEWLTQWLQFSTHLKESETSLYLHCMVLLTVNFPKHPRH
ncbi:LETM1 domain-containing protein 1 isoform X1 [Carassius auratus]|uniref:LETM1 domain-containing protein 1 isoform X1 n=1 Tax=Carassius auratus TaxID=7957 RepID=A0A6P6JD90_CARAU|nr:LETM1 domain-containing protein 1-like isoform X1 [Carassius auratus]XP_052450583.1 LETM1 domain-containing protein 1 isoform X1 [Carassius gibelio]